MSRYLPVVSRDESAVEEAPATTPSWYGEFVSHMEKSSTRSQRSVYEEISAIMGNSKSKFSSVEEVVSDLNERTGLKAILDARKVLAALTEPEEFKTIPEMKIFIDNFIEDRPGTSVEAVVHDLLKLPSIKDRLPDRTDVSEDVRHYINKIIGETVRSKGTTDEVNMHIGKVDSNSENMVDDPLSVCDPART